MKRGHPLTRRTRLQARTPFRRGNSLPREGKFSGAGDTFKTGKQAAMRRTPLAPVSGKRARENRERREMIARLYPERPCCARPGCGRMADDVHEPLTRARGGSITDPANVVPLCRPHHDELTFRPESELAWAYEAGLLRHSWDAKRETA